MTDYLLVPKRDLAVERAFDEAFQRPGAFAAWERGELGDRLPPPPDLLPGAQSVCATCAVTPEANRCAGCPRPRNRIVVVAQAPKEKRRRRLLPWRREKD